METPLTYKFVRTFLDRNGWQKFILLRSDGRQIKIGKKRYKKYLAAGRIQGVEHAT